MKILTRQVLVHIIGSIAFLSIPILSSPDFNSGMQIWHITPFLNHFFSQVLLLLYFYCNYYYFLSKLFFGNRKVVFFLVTIVFFALLIYLPNLFFSYEMRPFPSGNKNAPMPPPNTVFRIFEGKSLQFVMVFLLSYLLKLAKRIEQIKIEKQQAEIAYLQAQINPHFLFNTLNSIYALTLLKSDEAAKAVIKLSGIMRHVTSESSKEFVFLDKEIEYIKNYVALQKLRIGDNVEVRLQIFGDINNKKIVPLVLMTYIENAFKYGVNTEEESFIYITINVSENQLELSVKNSNWKTAILVEENSGNGMENTAKRLKVLYPNKHQLMVKSSEDMHEVHLKLFLS